MHRSGWVRGATFLQLLFGALLAFVCVYLFFLIHSPAVRQGAYATQTILGMKIAIAVIGFPAMLVTVAAFGMWKGKRWGWWCALATDLGLLSLFIYSMVDDGWNALDWEMVAFTLLPLFLIPVLLLPAVRSFYLQKRQTSISSTSSTAA